MNDGHALDMKTEDGSVHIYPAHGGGAYITADSSIGMRGCSLSADNIVDMIAALARVLQYVATTDPPPKTEAKP